MKLRQLSLILTGLFIFLCVQSCSLHIEKRRYRKGYHVQVIGNPSIKRFHIQERDQLINQSLQKPNANNNDSVHSVKKDSLPIPLETRSKIQFIPKQLTKPLEDRSGYRRFIFGSNPKHIKHAKS